MRELSIVLQREFLERVRSRSFALSTMLTPIFFLLVLVGPLLSDGMIDGDDHFIAVLDQSGLTLGPEVASTLSLAGGSGADEYHAAAIASTRAATQDSLIGVVLAGELDGLVQLPPDVLQGGSVQYLARSVTDPRIQSQISQAVTSAVQGRRLSIAGIDRDSLDSIMAPVPVEAARLTREGETGESAESGMIFSILVGFALYMLIMLYGVQVLQSVQEEKTNRIAEILVSSVHASQLMLGKVLGVGLAALLQIVIWLLLAVAVAPALAALAGEPTGAAEVAAGLATRTDPGLLAVVLAYLLLGFFLYASLFAAAGAAAGSTEDAQRFTLPLVMPLVVPMLLTRGIVAAPDGALALTLGWFPLTMPLTMPMRIGAGGTTPLEVGASLVVLLASVVGLGVIAGKIYRIGILSTGRRPSARDLMHWLRTA
jgi:ABC-2 type transport system permease protein